MNMIVLFLVALCRICHHVKLEVMLNHSLELMEFMEQVKLAGNMKRVMVRITMSR